MERLLSPEERIRRAEEIYYRRRKQNVGVRVASYNVNKNEKKDFKLLKKILIQILACAIIYGGIYLVRNSNYIFSESFIENIKSILEYDINLQNVYNNIINYFSTFKIENITNKEENKTNEEEIKNSEENNNVQEKNEESNNEMNGQTENIGGAIEESTEVKTNLSQMEIDANDIKNKYEIIKPLEGTITSRFGQREPTTATVPKNHTGIDIAANTGTKIIAALDGVVEISSSQGDYGEHLKIVKDNVAIIYGHCSKLYKKEGEEVKQGEVIAEVGATGNATGPHLHFEIRKENRYVNPDNILEF